MFGYTKGGHEFLQTFRHLKQRYLVIDYDPEVVEYLEQQGIRHAYGDATDLELLEELNINHAKVVVSTIDEYGVNVVLLNYLKHHKSEALFICHADHLDQAKQLYDLGATYVVLPHYIGSERLSSHMKKHGITKEAFTGYRQKQAQASDDLLS